MGEDFCRHANRGDCPPRQHGVRAALDRGTTIRLRLCSALEALRRTAAACLDHSRRPANPRQRYGPSGGKNNVPAAKSLRPHIAKAYLKSFGFGAWSLL